MKLLQNYSLMLTKCVTMLLFIAFTFASCKKDKDDVAAPPVPSPVVGKWSGVMNTDGAPVGNLYLVFKQGGAMEAQNIAGQKLADGTWQLGGSAGITFSCTFTTTTSTPQKFNFLGTLVSPTLINGSWGTGNSQFNGGFFNITK